MSTELTDRKRASRHRLVHPRYVWGGLALSILGCLILGVGILLLTWTVSIVGAALTILGAVVGVVAGGLKDARPEFTVDQEIREVARGDVHRGIAPGTMIDDPRVRADAIRTSHMVRELLAPRSARARTLARPAGAVLMVVMVGVYALAAVLVTSTPTGQTVALRDMGLAMVIGVAGFRLLTTPGPHPFTAGVGVLAGGLLALQGIVGAHGNAALGPIEATCGVLALIAAGTPWLSPDRPAGEQPGHPEEQRP